MSKICYLLIVSILLFSCKKLDNNALGKDNSSKKEIIEKNTLDGHWQLEKVDDNLFDIDKILDYDQEQPTMIINLKEKTVQGFSGCNTYNGNIQSNSFSLNFSNIVATEIGCDIDAWEIDYFRRLSEIQKFDFIGKDLKVFGRNGESMLFKKLSL